ncbi:hypothetical protein FisN_13Hh314 [Fistulifera solaris]|uniref:Choline transporter-like protein n=1 Tax=Fistulifera solaris TaxID=1519565 RepID=A0A1Z5KN57_FISSO|nr:hypothetical protein FisN_13Hh314 [Fistulifera solaris]|eukprot:GAX27597.1 hypothetical protein FisN_13Hh314 [Fistulifera solaris]
MSSDPELQEPLLEESPPVVVVEDANVLVEETRAEASFETNENDGVGHEQPAVYRDVLFAVLFYLQVVLMMGTAVWSFQYLWKQEEPDTIAPTVAPTAAPISNFTTYMQEDEAEWMFPSDKEERQIVAWTLGFLVLSLACAMVSVTLVLVALQHYSHTAVQISFGIAPFSSLLVAILMTFVNPHACAPFWITAVLVALLSGIHYCVVRPYIPFTAANLKIGLQAVNATKSLFVYAALLQVMTMLYWIVAVTALSGIIVYYHNQLVPCGDDVAQQCHDSIPLWMAVLWLLAVYWTQSVVQNVIRATTAGAVGAWWFRSPDEEVEEEGGCCCCTGQQDVHDAWHRATTYSFGSICFGSLVVALVQVLERVVAEARRQRQRQHGHDSLWLCLLDCLIESLGRVLEYFNSWAFLYVGIYGYDYMSAGQHVMTLFQQRGFTFLLTHTLLFQVLRYIKGSIGLVSGAGLAVVGAVFVQNATHVVWAVFAFGFVAGWMLAGMILFVVESGVRTIMLCFVERPMDAAIHHPAAYQTLTAGWSRVYPEQFPHRSTTTETQAFV